MKKITYYYLIAIIGLFVFGTSCKKQIADVKAENPDDALKNIPWLKLKTSFKPSTGIFANIAYIHRICTVGGVAPDPAQATILTVGKEVKVPYMAVYIFYKEK